MQARICMCVGAFGLAFYAFGCDIVGGPCTYRDTPGTATVVDVREPDTDEANCENDPVKVTFDYVPTDPAQADLAATDVLLTISSGVNPPREWVINEGLTVGSQHPVTRRDITSGTCTPVLYELTDVDYDNATALCYP